MAVIPAAPVVGTLGWVVQPTVQRECSSEDEKVLPGIAGLLAPRSRALLPVAVNLGEILRVPTDQCHVLFWVVGLHPRTEYLKGRPEITHWGGSAMGR